MDWTTKVGVDSPDVFIDYRSKLLLLGSCFAESMGERFVYHKFQVDINPFGIVYNPFSMAHVLESILTGKRVDKEELLEVNGQWVSLHHHGRFSDPNQQACLDKINGRLERAAKELPHLDFLVMTWGTAWVYKHISQDVIVSNCHKIPDREFKRFRLDVGDIVNRYLPLFRELRRINPELRILFTVSPIRHWRDGAHENQLSKAILLLAVEQLQHHVDRLFYFPAYEIVLDELRDYRFYASDMLHMADATVEYIWEQFSAHYISPEAIRLMQRIGNLRKGMEHRPFHAQSAEYKRHIEKIHAEMDEITRQFPTISFNQETLIS